MLRTANLIDLEDETAMRKRLSLLLALMMCLFTISAVAQAAAPADSAQTEDVIEISPVENGTAVPFPEHNFVITLPSDWNVLEINDEQAQAGILYSCANPESTRTFSIAFTQFDAATDMDTVTAELATAYENVQRLTINGISFVSYNISASDVTGIATLTADGMGLYQFVFYPASDDEYGTLALQIAASIDTLE